MDKLVCHMSNKGAIGLIEDDAVVLRVDVIIVMKDLIEIMSSDVNHTTDRKYIYLHKC